jgi:tetratricopeptide (TPR) repeat protein
MAKENQNHDLGHLSRMWHETVKNIRTSMAQNQGNITERSPQKPEPAKAAPIPSDNELFAGPVHEELSAQQIFTGDENFYKSLENTKSAVIPQPQQQPQHQPQPQSKPQPQLQLLDAKQISIALGHKRFSTAQKILAAAIFLIAAVLLYELLVPVSISTSDSADRTAPAANKISNSESLITHVAQVAYPIPQQPQPQAQAQAQAQAQTQTQKQEPASDSKEPLTLKVAQTLYLKGNYSHALGSYEKLYKSLPPGPKDDVMRDFLQLQMALCVERTADYNQADYLLREILNSNSPAIRVTAYYHYGLLEIQKKQYLNARTKAYQAIALLDTIDFDKKWSSLLKQECYFLAAEAITREALLLGNADKDIPNNLWGNYNAADELFTKLDETQLRIFLESGLQQLNLAVLGPQIQKFDNQDAPTRYDITCDGASIEELLARFAADSAVELHWNLGSDESGIRQQLIYLHLMSMTSQQFVTAAAGCAGLLAQMDEKGTLNIFDPAEYSDNSEHISLLNNEAISLWQEYMLKFPADSRLANVHFAMGLLQTAKGRLTESISEYKLVANRFSRTSLSPYALLNSSKLKNSLNDYTGGYGDLKQLVEQFPDSNIAVKAYLYYAETTAKANLTAEAIRIYSKVYNLGISTQSQLAAAIGAGKCSYNLGDFESAVKWLSKYITLAVGSPDKDLYSAYLLLAKTYLASGNSAAACDAFQNAFRSEPSNFSKEEYIEAAPMLVEAYMQQGQFVQALDLLERIYSSPLSPKDSVGILLLKSKVLRAMGLVDKAVTILGDKAEYISDSQLRAEIYFQLCESYIEKGDLNLAYKKLTEILVLAKPGPLTYETSLMLGDVCLKLGLTSQAISVCTQLLELQPSEQIKQKTLNLLSMAYNQNKNYDKAALALLGQWK